jgi:hypothetical protein
VTRFKAAFVVEEAGAEGGIDRSKRRRVDPGDEWLAETLPPFPD